MQNDTFVGLYLTKKITKLLKNNEKMETKSDRNQKLTQVHNKKFDQNFTTNHTKCPTIRKKIQKL